MNDTTGPVKHRAENMPLLTFVDNVKEEGDTEIIQVTPYEADYVLKHRNPHNRNIRPHYAGAMARDMLRYWPVNGETMKFSDAGYLLDGQHRMTALASLVAQVPEGFTIRLLVTGGLPSSAQDTMDMGLKRSPGDVLRLHNIAHPTAVGAITNKLDRWEKGDYRFQVRRNSMTMTEILEFVDSHPGIHRSAEIARYVRNHFTGLPPSIIGLAHYVFTEIDADTAAWFFQRLADGADIQLGHPVLTLRESLTFDRRGGFKKGRVPEDEYMAMVVRAWNAVRRGSTLERVIGIRADGRMPMPE